jgi:predicted CopG family antitoxin
MARTTISVRESTHELLQRLKRADETYDDLLVRLAGDEEPIEIGAWSEADLERGLERRERNKESFGR